MIYPFTIPDMDKRAAVLEKMETLGDCIYAVAKDYRQNEMKLVGKPESADFIFSSVPDLCALWEYGKPLSEQPQAVIDLLYPLTQ